MLLKSKVKVNHSERVYCLRLQITILGYTALTLQKGALPAYRILPLMPKLGPPSQPLMTDTQMYSAENIIKTIYFSFAELRKFLEL